MNGIQGKNVFEEYKSIHEGLISDLLANYPD